MQTCIHCRLPLDADRVPVRRVSGEDCCNICADMLEAIANNDWFMRAHHEWRAEQERLRHL